MFKLLVGTVLLLFVIIFGSFFAIHAFSAVDDRVNVTADYADTFNATKAISEGGIGIASLLMYVVIGMVLILLFVYVLHIVSRKF